MRTRNGISLLAIISIALVGTAMAHDTWVEVNPTEVRIGQVVHVDLKLGNHGNDHRDFKLASKITLEPCTLAVDEKGEKFDKTAYSATMTFNVAESLP